MNAAVCKSHRVAVVGAGPAGAACAAALHAAGVAVVVFEKSRGVGGRMATRRTRYTDTQGHEHTVHFDHGAQHVQARDPRFLKVMQAAVAAGVATRWPMQLRDESLMPAISPVPVQVPVPESETRFLPVPGMPALCQQLLQGAALHLQHTVVELVPRANGGYVLRFAERPAAAPGLPQGRADDADHPDHSDHFDHVLLAMPPAQAAVLLASLHPAWSRELSRKVMHPCWTLMMVTDAPAQGSDAAQAIGWDAAAPASGPLAWVSRNDRRPGRTTPAGTVSWVAQASAAWTLEHLEDDPSQVAQVLQAALLQVLGAAAGAGLTVHHSAVHRWRYALAAGPGTATSVELTQPWWDSARGLGVCGDSLLGADVEAAWLSGDKLAQAVLATLPSRSAGA